MGFLGSSKKTKVATSTVRLLKEKELPSTIKTSMISSIMNNSRDLVGDLVTELLNGPTINMEQYYQKGASGDYYFGLPNAKVLNSTSGSDVIQTVLETQLGQGITIQYINFGAMHPVHMGFQHLAENYAYNNLTNEIEGLSTQKGFPVYLDTIISVFPVADAESADPGSLDNVYDNPRAGFTPLRPAQQDNTMGQYRLDGEIRFDEVNGMASIIRYVWEDSQGELFSEDLVLDLSTYNQDYEFFQVKYLTDSGDIGYWTYQDSAGTYPDVDAIHRVDYNSPGTYFPFVLFRRHKTNRTRSAVRNSEEFKSTEDLLSTLGMDFVEMGNAIHENPDIDDVEQAALISAVPANSTNNADRRYLFDFFSRLFDQSPDPTLEIPTGRLRAKIPTTDNAIVWRDADFKMMLSYGDITKRTRAGSVGEVGSYNSSVTSYEASRTVEETTPGKNGTTKDVTYTQTIYVRHYQHQVSEGFYQEISVVSPSLQYDIYRDYNYVGGPTSNELLIPLDKSITDTYSFSEREEIYYRSLRLVFNSRVTEKVKWYETGLFRFVLVVIAVVITVLSVGKAYGTLVAAANLGALSLTIAILKIILTVYVSKYAFKLVVKEIGVEAAYVLAIVLAAVTLGAEFDVIDIGTMLSPDNLLFAANGLATGVQSVTTDLVNDVQNDMTEFASTKTESEKELEKALELLDTSDLLNPFEFIGREPKTIFGESVDDYYYRSVHAGNIGTLGIKSVGSFVDISLTLPTTNSSLGDTFYG